MLVHRNGDRPAGASGTAEPHRPMSSGTSDTEAPLFGPDDPREVRPLDLRPVVPSRQSALERVRRPLPLSRIQDPGGAQMRYAVHDRDGNGRSPCSASPPPRGSSSATTSSDGPATGEKNLPFVVDNPRFLILPWINIPNHILALIRRRLPDDWTERYNTTPVLFECRRDPALHRRRLQGRLDPRRDHPGARALRPGQAADKPKLDVWLRPLRRDWTHPLATAEWKRPR